MKSENKSYAISYIMKSAVISFFTMLATFQIFMTSPVAYAKGERKLKENKLHK